MIDLSFVWHVINRERRREGGGDGINSIRNGDEFSVLADVTVPLHRPFLSYIFFHWHIEKWVTFSHVGKKSDTPMEVMDTLLLCWNFVIHPIFIFS